MLSVDRAEFHAAITTMHGTLGRNVTEAAIVGWWDALKDLQDTKLVFTAIRELTKHMVKLPTPRDVRDWYNNHYVNTRAPVSQYSHDDPRWPLRTEVMIARRMLPADVLADPLMGQPMLDYLAAHPEPAIVSQRGPSAGTVGRVMRGMAR